jgi:DNA gyrase subunit A
MAQNFNLNEKVQQDFLIYANAVIKSRAIPAGEDNLKPVHRRILYTMAEKKLWNDKKTMKCANVAGSVMLYHPHGDAAIYDALVHLAQPWKMRYPLIEIEGNIGSIMGYNAAASRYTECRLSPFGQMMLDGITDNSVPFKPNYDETTTEPVILPGAFPNILCNGNIGIAVGLSTNLIPHNLKEVSKGIFKYLQNRDVTLEELMTVIPGPDFPTGGIIIDGEKIADIYKFGSGSLTLRGKYRVETSGGKQVIVFTEVPYMVNIEEGVVAPIKKMVTEDGFDLIDEFENFTNKDGINLRIILKKGANVNKVLEELWKNTRLQVTQRVGNTVILKNIPRVLNLKDLIKTYVDHQHAVLINIYTTKLNKVLKSINVYKGLIITLDKLDKAISIIRESNDREEAKQRLMLGILLNEEQANAVLDMKLSRLTKLDRDDLMESWHDAEVDSDHFQDIISNPKRRDSLIQANLSEIVAKYGDNRRTQILCTSEAAPQLSKEPVNILFFSSGKTYMTTTKLKEIDFSKKNNKLNESPIVASVAASVVDTLLVFFDTGSIAPLKVSTLNLDELEDKFNIEPINVDNIQETKKTSIVFITREGIVKKTNIAEYQSIKSVTMGLKLRENDSVIYAAACSETDEVYILGMSGKLVKFKVSDIVSTGKLTIGSKGIGEQAAFATIAAEGAKIFSINNEGQAKLSDDYSITAKGGSGQVITEGTKFLSSKSYVFVGNGKKNTYYDVSGLAVKGKTAVGAKLVNEPTFSIAN